MAECLNALKEWTGKSTVTIIYDSMVDEFTDECMFQTVRGKPNIAIVATTTEGDVFGGFHSVAVTEQNKQLYDPNIFAFSFESHGRCMTPQRFYLSNESNGMAVGVFFKNNTLGRYVMFHGANGGLSIGNEKSNPWCFYQSQCLVGVEDTTLAGKEDSEKFTCSRLVAIQLE